MSKKYLDENGLSYFWNKIKERLSNKEVMFRKSETHIQWKYSDDVEWTDLVAIDDLKGIDGIDGHTPIKGTDYWTMEDKAEIVADVLAALPNGDEVMY